MATGEGSNPFVGLASYTMSFPELSSSSPNSSSLFGVEVLTAMSLAVDRGEIGVATIVSPPEAESALAFVAAKSKTGRVPRLSKSKYKKPLPNKLAIRMRSHSALVFSNYMTAGQLNLQPKLAFSWLFV